jgi:hypothetical protein
MWLNLNRIGGAGTCDELGYVNVKGTYTDSTPVRNYDCVIN